MKAGVRHKLENHKYSCEKNIRYPEFSKSDFENYNREHNNPKNLHFVKRVNRDKMDKNKNEGGKDIQGLIWDEPAYSSLLTDLQNFVEYQNVKKLLHAALDLRLDPCLIGFLTSFLFF